MLFLTKKYIREETLSIEHFARESKPDKLLDIHTIEWRMFDNKQHEKFGSIEYFSNDHGWSDGKILDKLNPVPEIEKVFKETIGKDLIYFEYSK